MKRLQVILKNNKLLIIGVLVGITLSIGSVYAATILYQGNEVSYNTTNTSFTNTDVQGAIDELYNKTAAAQAITTCPATARCEWKKSWSEVAVGDYVQMTPNPGTLDSSNRYATDKTKTGYSSVQYIYPKELKLWRVIKVNTDGTIEMVSEYVSSTAVSFGQTVTNTTGEADGVIGYKNIVGYLNTLANQYQNPVYTISARHMGYHGQTETLTDTSVFDGTYSSYPWSSSTTTTENQLPSNEPRGGGDTMYAYDTATDTGLVQVAYGNLGSDSLKAFKCNNSSCNNPTALGDYFLAARRYYKANAYYQFDCRYISTSGSLSSGSLRRNQGTWYAYVNSHALRPIVTLKSGLNPPNAFGTKEKPFILE